MPVVASFTYVDANGSAVARIDRVEPGRDGRPKEFLPYLSDGAGGFAERPGLNGTVLPLYHRDEILGCPPETPGFILEGEGKCDVFREALRAGGSAAVTTTIAGGASAPLRPEHIADLILLQHIYFIADSDEPGRTAAATRSQRVVDANPSIDVRVLDLFPDANDGSDINDWLKAGHSIAELRQLLRKAPRITARELSPPTASDGVLSFDELAARTETKPVNWLIEGFLRDSGIALLTSPPKVGKSELARGGAKSVATGTEFLRRRCRKGRVLFIELEEPLSHVLDRIEVFGLKDLPISWVVDQPQGDCSRWLRQVVAKHEPTMVVIDTIQRLAKVDDINDYAKVAKATQPLLDIRAEFGTSFMVLHHNGKGGRVIGSTQWEAFVDTIATITRSPEGERFLQTTQRSGINMEPTRLHYDPDTGITTVAGSKFMADQRASEQKILTFCGEIGRPATREELARRGGRSASAGRSAVDALVSAGLLAIRGSGTRNDPRLYIPTRESNASSNIYHSYTDEEPEETEALPEGTPRKPRPTPMLPEEPEHPEEPDGDIFGYAGEVFGDD